MSYHVIPYHAMRRGFRRARLPPLPTALPYHTMHRSDLAYLMLLMDDACAQPYLMLRMDDACAQLCRSTDLVMTIAQESG